MYAFLGEIPGGGGNRSTVSRTTELRGECATDWASKPVDEMLRFQWLYISNVHDLNDLHDLHNLHNLAKYMNFAEMCSR